jgi:hypothetical protein
MRALSVRQPWVWAIIHAGKDVENRKWQTNLRETIAIHASGNLDKDAVLPGGRKPTDEDLKDRGCIIGVAEIVDVVTKSSSNWFVGPYGFVLKNPQSLPEPIPCKGALGFWRIPPDVLEEMEIQLTEGSDKPSA